MYGFQAFFAAVQSWRDSVHGDVRPVVPLPDPPTLELGFLTEPAAEAVPSLQALALTFPPHQPTVVEAVAQEGSDSPSKVNRKPAVKRPRLLKPGSLTLAVHGADEAYKWEARVATFTGTVSESLLLAPAQGTRSWVQHPPANKEVMRCRHVLGDRALVKGQWGGSVLDSVIGTFLTQNAADVLSSQAFMTLVARYPAQVDSRSQSVAPQDKSGHVHLGWSAHAQSKNADSCSSIVSSQSIKTAQSDACANCTATFVAKHALEVSADAEGTSMAAVAMRQEDPCASVTQADSVNWEAVLAAPATEIADAIKCRGMHNSLALRIQVRAYAAAIQ
ncbi:hypothetical protein MMC29_003004 [Sticta canariensis]|nr:hypothetical protein [Sticta canariensis]